MRLTLEPNGDNGQYCLCADGEIMNFQRSVLITSVADDVMTASVTFFIKTDEVPYGVEVLPSVTK